MKIYSVDSNGNSVPHPELFDNWHSETPLSSLFEALVLEDERGAKWHWKNNILFYPVFMGDVAEDICTASDLWHALLLKGFNGYFIKLMGQGGEVWYWWADWCLQKSKDTSKGIAHIGTNMDEVKKIVQGTGNNTIVAVMAQSGWLFQIEGEQLVVKVNKKTFSLTPPTKSFEDVYRTINLVTNYDKFEEILFK